MMDIIAFIINEIICVFINILKLMNFDHAYTITNSNVIMKDGYGIKINKLRIISEIKIMINNDEKTIAFKNLTSKNMMLVKACKTIMNYEVGIYKKHNFVIEIFFFNDLYLYVLKENFGYKKNYNVIHNTLNSSILNYVIQFFINLLDNFFIHKLKLISKNQMVDYKLIEFIKLNYKLNNISFIGLENNITMNYNELIHLFASGLYNLKQIESIYQLDFGQTVSYLRNCLTIYDIQTTNFVEIYNYLIENFEFSEFEKFLLQYLTGVSNKHKSIIIKLCMKNCYKMRRISNKNNKIKILYDDNMEIKYISKHIIILLLYLVFDKNIIFIILIKHLIIWIRNSKCLNKIIITVEILILMLYFIDYN
jgi:hypothetical protein